jgi:hypothetical protein
MAEVRGSSPLSSIGAEPRSDAGSDDTDSHGGETPIAVFVLTLAGTGLPVTEMDAALDDDRALPNADEVPMRSRIALIEVSEVVIG